MTISQCLIAQVDLGAHVPSTFPTWDAQNQTFGPCSIALTIKSDGSITVADYTTAFSAGGTYWYTPITGGIGASYWVRATAVDTGAGNRVGTLNSWLQLNSDRVWSVDTSIGGYGLWGLKIEIATDAGGSNIVCTGYVYIYAEVMSVPDPP